MAALPRLELVWADAAYTGPFAKWLETECCWRTEVPFHRKRQAWRYGLEERRLVRDYEQRLDVSKAMIHIALGSLMLRRIVHP